jgi:pilus assembly protein Flp/PilA
MASKLFNESGNSCLHELDFHDRGQRTMLEFTRTLLALRLDRRGVTAMEYGLIAALIAVVIIGGVTAIGTKLAATFQLVAAALPT